MSEAEQIDKIIDQYSIHRPRGQAKGTLARAELKKRLRKVVESQPIHPVDGELFTDNFYQWLEYNGVEFDDQFDDGEWRASIDINKLKVGVAAHLQAAVRKTEGRIANQVHEFANQNGGITRLDIHEFANQLTQPTPKHKKEK